MKKVFWRKQYDCPLCGHSFEAIRVFSNAISVKSRDLYLKTQYEGPNPSYYTILVCPNCYYTAYESDFTHILSKMSSEAVNTLKNALHKAKKELTFSLEEKRTTQDALAIHTLAAITYTCLEDRYKLAQIYLKMSWLYEDVHQPENMQIAGAKALDLFLRAFESERKRIEEDTTLFFLGSLHIKYHHYREGGRWLERLIKGYRGKRSPYLAPAKKLWEEMRSVMAHEQDL